MKKFLLTLFAWIFWFWCFCSAVDLSLWNSNHLLTVNQWTNTFSYNIPAESILEIIFTNWSDLQLTFNWNTYPAFWNWYFFFSFLNRSSDSESITFDLINNSWSKKYWQTYDFLYFTWSSLSCSECQECQTCPEVNTWEILSWYILESEIDTNYCVWNWLCPNECWSWTDFSWDLVFSNLYINNILHPWKSNIFVEIPDYITWDYSIDTWSFNLYVWSWYDVDYINSIIDINSYRPWSEDFTNIFVSWLTLIFPYIFVLLFIIFVRKLLKRVFK